MTGHSFVPAALQWTSKGEAKMPTMQKLSSMSLTSLLEEDDV